MAKTETESKVMQDILDWSKSRPAWQRDALRRIIINGELGETDFAELETPKTPFCSLF